MFNRKEIDLLSNQVCKLENTLLELVEITNKMYDMTIQIKGNATRYQMINTKSFDEIKELISDSKALLEKKTICRKVEKRHNAVNRDNPFINRKANRPLVVAIEDRNYSVKEMQKMFGVSKVTITTRIQRLIDLYKGKTDIQQFFYKRSNGYKVNDKTTGKKWIITSEGAKLLVRSFDMEVC